MRRETGQTATEYVLVLAVVVAALVSAAYAIVPHFGAGVRNLAESVRMMLETHGVNMPDAASPTEGPASADNRGDDEIPPFDFDPSACDPVCDTGIRRADIDEFLDGIVPQVPGLDPGYESPRFPYNPESPFLGPAPAPIMSLEPLGERA